MSRQQVVMQQYISNNEQAKKPQIELESHEVTPILSHRGSSQRKNLDL